MFLIKENGDLLNQVKILTEAIEVLKNEKLLSHKILTLFNKMYNLLSNCSTTSVKSFSYQRACFSLVNQAKELITEVDNFLSSNTEQNVAEGPVDKTHNSDEDKLPFVQSAKKLIAEIKEFIKNLKK